MSVGRRATQVGKEAACRIQIPSIRESGKLPGKGKWTELAYHM